MPSVYLSAEMKLCVSSVLLDARAEIQLLAGMEGWHLAGSASCARFSDGRVHHTKNKPAKGAETHRKSRKMSCARSRGITERWSVELTVSRVFFVRSKHRGLRLKITLGAFPGYLSEYRSGIDPGPASSSAGLNFFLNFLPF